MLARTAAINRGKTGAIQNFSLARQPDPSKTALLQSSIGPNFNDQHRTQVRFDSGAVFQCATRYGDTFGFFTRPSIGTDGDGEPMVCGSFSDAIGQCVPVKVPLDHFNGYFTTLIRRGDALALGLATHPSYPDSVGGPPVTRNGDPTPASLARLGFPQPEEAVDDDRPVVVALPLFLPLPFGVTFPHPTELTAVQPFRDTSLLLAVWVDGIRYAMDRDNGQSVTEGGPLFHLPLLQVEDGTENPIASHSIKNRIPRSPTLLNPTEADYASTAQRISAWSTDIWHELGANMVVDDPPPPAPGPQPVPFTPEAWADAAVKAKVFKNADRNMARLRVTLGGKPPEGSVTPGEAVLPVLLEDAVAYFKENSNATACEDLKEMVRAQLAVANSSDYCRQKDATLSTHVITLWFSNAMKTQTWSNSPVRSITLAHVKTELSIIHFLPPDLAALEGVAAGDSAARTLVMANAGSSTAQLDAARASKLYIGGRCGSFTHIWEAACSLEVFFRSFTESPENSLLMTKLFEYVSLLRDRVGKEFWEAMRNHPYLALFALQECQMIVSAFFRLGADATLYRAAEQGQPVALANYSTAIAVADGAISELKAILNGNGVGKFVGEPVCIRWFPHLKAAARPTRTPAASRTTPSSSDNKRQKVDPEAIERRKANGVLVFDSSAAGTTTLPACTVLHKRKGSTTALPMCAPFLTRDYACTLATCKKPHPPKLKDLPVRVQKDLLNFVKTTPGFTWVPGFAPPGAN